MCRSFEGQDVIRVTANGQRVWAESVGGAVRRYESLYFSRKAVPVASQYGAIFASPDE